MPQFKQINFFHLCSDVIIEEGTKKMTIIGDFNKLSRKQPDTNIPSIFVFAAVLNFSGDRGSYKVKLEIRDTKGINILQGMADAETKIDEGRTAVIWKLAATFQEYGQYNVEVYINGETVFRMPFLVLNA